MDINSGLGYTQSCHAVRLWMRFSHPCQRVSKPLSDCKFLPDLETNNNNKNNKKLYSLLWSYSFLAVTSSGPVTESPHYKKNLFYITGFPKILSRRNLNIYSIFTLLLSLSFGYQFLLLLSARSKIALLQEFSSPTTFWSVKIIKCVPLGEMGKPTLLH